MLAKLSAVNEGNIEFYKEPEMIEVPLWEFSKQQLETKKAWLESELALTVEMLTHFIS